MTVGEAAKQWIKAKRAIRAAEPELKQAEKVLKEHFRKTGKSDYKGLIGYAKSVVPRLDTVAVRAFLGKKVAEFEVPSPRESLSLLKDA